MASSMRPPVAYRTRSANSLKFPAVEIILPSGISRPMVSGVVTIGSYSRIQIGYIAELFVVLHALLGPAF